MKAEGTPFYVSTPIYYVNDRPHIGHVYTTTVADIMARYQRLRGRDVFFLTGTDEHAAKVSDAASERGLSAQEWADQNAAHFKAAFQELGMSHDDFIRTTESRHKDRVVAWVAQLLKSGDVYLGEYEGWYDAGQEEYVPDNKAKEQEYLSAINGKPLVKKSEKNYFFRLSNYASPLREHYDQHQDFLLPRPRRNEILGRIDEGLNDIPISRTGAEGWGIPMPGDEEHTIYVWIDALFNYLSAVDTDERRHYWPASVHCLAKDILWFHAAVWPAMLLALQKIPGNEWIKLPKQVFAHSFWIREGRKMSKTLGNFVDREEIDAYVSDFSLDGVRYYLATMGPMGASDRDFARDRFIETYNTELANVVGNSASRVASMITRYCDARLPETSSAAGIEGYDALGESVKAAQLKYEDDMLALRIDHAAQSAVDVFRAIDLFIDRSKPFKLAKDPEAKDQVGTILRACAEAVEIGSLLLWPTMPEKMTALRAAYGFAAIGGEGCSWPDSAAQTSRLNTGTAVEKTPPLFARWQEESKA